MTKATNVAAIQPSGQDPIDAAFDAAIAELERLDANGHTTADLIEAREQYRQQQRSASTNVSHGADTTAPDGERIWSEVHDTPYSMTFAELTPDAKLEWIDDQLQYLGNRIFGVCYESTDPGVKNAPGDLQALGLMIRMVRKEEVEMSHHVNNLLERLGYSGFFAVSWKPEITWEPDEDAKDS